MLSEPLFSIIEQLVPDLQVSREQIQGGQKIVVKGQCPQFGNIVVKVVCPSDESEKQRALREIDIASKLNAPYFAKLFKFGTFRFDERDFIYIIEELIDGKSLREVIEGRKPGLLPKTEQKRIIESLLNALLITEPLQRVHRDIKPENIMITSDRVVLIDFGIARHLEKNSLTDSYAFFGPMTPGYAAPEQIRNEKRKISIRTDLFSVGVLFYELATGMNPFLKKASSPQQAVAMTLQYNPAPLAEMGFSEPHNDFVAACLQKNVHRRPASIVIAIEMFKKIKWE